MAYDKDFYFLHFCFPAEGATAKINIIVKPRDSNNVLPELNTNEFSRPAQNGWEQPDYEKNLIKSRDNNQVYGVVRHNDYSYDNNLHMTYNEVLAHSAFRETLN